MLGLPTPSGPARKPPTSARWSTPSRRRSPLRPTASPYALVDLEAFNDPIQQALDAGIPVLSYNADAPNARMAYVGQDLYGSGFAMGERIVELVGEGKVGVVHRHARPAEHPAAHRRGARRDRRVRRRHRGPRHRIRRRASRGAAQRHRGVVPRQHRRRRHVRRRRRQHAGDRPGRAEPERTRPGPLGRRGLRPATDDGRAGLRGRDRLHDRSAAVPAGLPAGASTSTSGSCPAVSSSRRRRTPAWCSSTQARRSCSSTPRAGSRATPRSSRSSSRSAEQEMTTRARDRRERRRTATSRRRPPSRRHRRSSAVAAADLIARRRRRASPSSPSCCSSTSGSRPTRSSPATTSGSSPSSPPPVAILAIGQTMLLVCGEIDLSLGNVYLMTPFLMFRRWSGAAAADRRRLRPRRGGARRARQRGRSRSTSGIPSFITTLGHAVDPQRVHAEDLRRLPEAGADGRVAPTGSAAPTSPGSCGRSVITVDAPHRADQHAMGRVHGRHRRQPDRRARGRRADQADQGRQLHARRRARRVRRDHRGDPDRLVRSPWPAVAADVPTPSPRP